MNRVLDIIDSGLFEPCEVELRISENDTRVFSCQSSLRLLTSRRLTALATSGGKKYVIKIFPQRKRSMQEYEEEIDGYELLHTASIDIPPRIYHGPAQERLNIIVYKYISRARTLSEVCMKKPVSRLERKVLKRFAELTDRLHRSSLIHEDPHLDNFLIKGDVITVLDAGAVRRVRNEALIEKNYGLFVAQFPVSWRMEGTFWEHYSSSNKVDDEYLTRLQDHVKFWQVWREKHYLKKIYRECTAFHVHSSMSGKIIIDRNYLQSGLMELLNNPDRAFKDGDVDMLKAGNSASVGLVALNESEFVVKRYNVKNTVHRIKRVFAESRASRSWRNAHRLMLRGIETARPVAMAEYVKGKHKGVSLFVMENVGGEHSAAYFRRKSILQDTKREVAARMLNLINELHEERILHGDLKSTNFIIKQEHPVVIDLDAMKVARKNTNMEKAVNKEWQRFQDNWNDHKESKILFDELMQSAGKL